MIIVVRNISNGMFYIYTLPIFNHNVRYIYIQKYFLDSDACYFYEKSEAKTCLQQYIHRSKD
jgi:hypothetical protein